MEEKDGNVQSLVAFLVVGVIVVLIVPVWWNATKVYRATIPENKISALLDAGVKVPIATTLYLLDELYDIVDASNLTSTLRANLSHISKEYYGNFGYKVNIENFVLFSREELNLSSNSMSNFEMMKEKLASFRPKHVDPSKDRSEKRDGIVLKLYIIHDFVQKDRCNSLYGLQNHLFVVTSYTKNDQGNTIDCVKESIQNLFPKLSKVIRKSPSGIIDQSNNALQKRGTQHSSGLQLAFVLVNPQPDKIMATWNIKEDFHCVFEPFLSKVKDLGPFNVSSQVLYYTEFPRKPIKGNFGMYYKKEALPSLMNHLESRIESFTSNLPILYFVVYVTPPAQSPLSIKIKKDNFGASFLSPKWGGVYFYNVNTTEYDQNHTVLELDARPALRTFIDQLRLLIGLKQERGQAQRLSSQLVPIDMTLLMLEDTVRNLVLAAETLNSLCKLIKDIHNIVISDSIKDLVEMAVGNSTLAMELLSQGKLNMAYKISRLALSFSEEAFFDPSLLELLYFPDDQKYAIYVPFFLPVSVPIVLASLKSVKHLRSSGR